MSTNYKSNDNQLLKNSNGEIFLPLPPEEYDLKNEMEIYARFMRHLRMVPNSNENIKILSAIQFTADLLNQSDAYIAKTLVDSGLRAPRAAFPEDYLEFVDQSCGCRQNAVGAASKSTRALQSHWHNIEGSGKCHVNRYSVSLPDGFSFIET